jgi:hypothetical protein
MLSIDFTTQGKRAEKTLKRSCVTQSKDYKHLWVVKWPGTIHAMA